MYKHTIGIRMPPPKDPEKRNDWIEKIRRSHIGKPLSEDHKNKLKVVRSVAMKDPKKREKILKCLDLGRKIPEERKNRPFGERNVFWRGGKVKTTCLCCGKEFEVFPCRIKSARKYCSIKCRSEHFRTRLQGKENPNWHNGASFEPYCEKFNKEFKNRVRAFFNFTCVVCGRKQEEDVKGQSLHVHHINYRKDACCNSDAVPLFITLCSHCHGKVHYKREYWNAHFQSIIEQKYNGKCYFTKEEFRRRRL